MSRRAASERISEFLATYSTFRHASDLRPILTRADPAESLIEIFESARLDDEFRAIYRLRAQHVTTRGFASLADDLEELVEGFDRAADQPLRIWRTLVLATGLVYLVFELASDGRIAGCVKSEDRRIANSA